MSPSASPSISPSEAPEYSCIEVGENITEVDPESQITQVSETTTISYSGLSCDATSYAYANFSSGYFDGDFTFRFIINTDVASGSGGGFYYCFGLSNQSASIQETWEGSDEDDDSLALGISAQGASTSIAIWECYDGTENSSDSISISRGTDYFITFKRDDSYGSAGQVTLIVCTGNYYGSGGSLVGAKTYDLNERNDYTYVFWVCSHTFVLDDYTFDGYTKNICYIEEI